MSAYVTGSRPQTQEALTAKLKSYDSDCCFCNSITGADKVTSVMAQMYINEALNAKKTPDGKCGPVRWACSTYVPKALSCQKSLQPPVETTDTTEQRVKRCGFCILGSTVCAPCAIAKLYTADTQAALLLKGPNKQVMA